MRHLGLNAFAAAEPAPSTFDPTDVPSVPARHLALAMRLLIENGRGLVLLRGFEDEDRAVLDAEFWRAFDGDTATGVATLLRLESLAAVFAAARLRRRFLDTGHALIPLALLAAARMRLNAAWGFNPQRTLAAMAEAERITTTPARASPALDMLRAA